MINKGQISAKQCQSFLSREQPNVNMEVIKNTLKIETEACNANCQLTAQWGGNLFIFLQWYFKQFTLPCSPYSEHNLQSLCWPVSFDLLQKTALRFAPDKAKSILGWILTIVSSILGKTTPWLFLLSTMGHICKTRILHLILHLTAESISLATITNTLAAKGEKNIGETHDNLIQEMLFWKSSVKYRGNFGPMVFIYLAEGVLFGWVCFFFFGLLRSSAKTKEESQGRWFFKEALLRTYRKTIRYW